MSRSFTAELAPARPWPRGCGVAACRLDDSCRLFGVHGRRSYPDRARRPSGGRPAAAGEAACLSGRPRHAAGARQRGAQRRGADQARSRPRQGTRPPGRPEPARPTSLLAAPATRDKRPASRHRRVVGRSWGHGRISPHPAPAALRVRAGQPGQGGCAQCRRRHHRSRHGQPGPAGARRMSSRSSRRRSASRAPTAIRPRTASRACAAPRPPTTSAASA